MKVGQIGWIDLTVEDAEGMRDFYSEVVGWKPAAVHMGTYDDFNMTSADDADAVAGICHAHGANANLPPVWLIYVVVADLNAGIAKCEELGGKVVVQPRKMNGAGYCVIQDPAGAYCALYQPEA